MEKKHYKGKTYRVSIMQSLQMDLVLENLSSGSICPPLVSQGFGSWAAQYLVGNTMGAVLSVCIEHGNLHGCLRVTRTSIPQHMSGTEALCYY